MARRFPEALERAKAKDHPSFFQPGRSLLTPSEGWLTVSLLFGVQITSVLAVHTSDWVDPSPRLWLIAIVGFVTSLFASKVNSLSGFLVALAAGSALGVGVAIWESVGTLSGPLFDRFGELFTRLGSWVDELGASGGISNDKLPFASGLALLAFAMPFLSTITYFRYRWSWPAVIIPAIALLTNQTYLPDSRYIVPTFFFLLLAIFFLGRVHYLSRLERWRQQGTKRLAGRYSFAMNVVVLTMIVFVVGWSIPTRDVVIPELRDVYQDARGPWRDLEDEFERVFAGVSSKRGSPLHRFGAALPLRGGISPAKGTVLDVITDLPAYWRGQSYDFYQGRGWIALDELRSKKKLSDINPLPEANAYRKREVLAQHFVLQGDTNVLLAAGQPIEFSIDANVQIATPRVYAIDLRGGDHSADLPADISAVVAQVVATRGGSAETQALLPPETRIIGESSGWIAVSRDPPDAPDVLAAEARGRRLKANDSYEVISSISVATSEDLRGAGSTYPKWVTDNYLQLPAGLPDRVTELAIKLTSGFENPYDKGIVISKHLRSFTQTYNIPPPPLNADAIDHFLFVQKAGYSDYFASAMAVLLRASGVPARLASGYATGEFDPETSSYSVAFSDAHSWPEVFFPDFGWIAFEPSPDLQPIEHGVPSAPDLQEGSDGVVTQNPFDEFLDLFGQSPDDTEGLDQIRPQKETSVADVFRSVIIRIGLAIAALGGLALTLAVLVFLTWEVNFVGLTYEQGLYARMSRLGAYAGLSSSRPQTPGEYASQLAGSTALNPADTAAIAHGFTKVRYGAQSLSQEQRDRLQERWVSVRNALIGRLFRRLGPRRWSRG